MGWLALYVRSRRVLVSLAALVICVVVLCLALGDAWSPRFAAIVFGSAIAMAGAGLSGQDLDLDRTAAFGWPPRRLGHILLLGAVTVGAALAVQSVGDVQLETAWIVREAAGLMGLTGLAATFFGGYFCWILPLGWVLMAQFVPGKPGLQDMLAWPTLSAENPTAWLMAGALFLVGTATYTAVGARR
ncbi:hypothetical protein [Amycolatopsis jejuensis]|uniref:hypothetical protein n=1 Tax=Amycolatopsis jejuensis TaxID=330084 RepID=UPI00052619D6|nr:hypothetical protein [Amycolatopsis jejuensis]